MARSPKLLEEHWRTFLADVLAGAGEWSEHEIQRYRDVFFSGARAATDLVGDDLPSSLVRELEDFERDVVKRTGGTH